MLHDLRSAEDTSDDIPGGMFFNTGRIGGVESEGNRGNKCCSRVLLISARVVVFSSNGKRSGGFPTTIFLVFHTDCELTSARNCVQCTLLAT